MSTPLGPAASYWRQLTMRDQQLMERNQLQCTAAQAPTYGSRDEYRSAVSRCTHCQNFKSQDDIMVNPRYGAGAYDHAKLMIIGQNPPADPVRRLHGAWMLHYSALPKGPSEELVAQLVGALGLVPKEVWGTQVFKCATVKNVVPHRYLATRCAHQFLRHEITQTQPAAILCFGLTVRMVLEDLDLVPRDDSELYSSSLPSEVWQNYVIPTDGNWYIRPPRVRTCGRFIFAPHPSHARRFLQPLQGWIDTIKLAYDRITS